MFSSNDRSRWALVRALVDEGTFVIGRRDPYTKPRSAVLSLGGGPNFLQTVVLIAVGNDYRDRLRGDSGIIFEESYQSVDKVLHPTRLEFYSTKPPLLAVMVAGEYWVLKHLFGWSLVEHPFKVVRTVLITINILPLALYLLLLARLADRFARTDWARYYIVAAGGFATLVTPFLVTFNNHTIATTTALVAVWAVVRILEDGSPRWWLFALAGLMAGFTACNELPATSLAVGLMVFLLWKRPRQTLLLAVPAALLPVVALFAINYIQLGQLRPAYAEFGGPWYEYEGSHWLVPPGQTKRGIDFAGRNGETKLTYAFHLLFGHHGLFLLTPVVLLAFVGMFMALLLHRRSKEALERDEQSKAQAPVLRLFSLFALLVSVVVIAFYIVKSDNYGGWSNGPRWLMWLSPLWLLTMLPALDWLASWRWGRVIALVLLLFSIMSMNYQSWNSWRHPWAYNWMESRGWVNY
jgi:hypothetical protein